MMMLLETISITSQAYFGCYAANHYQQTGHYCVHDIYMVNLGEKAMKVT